jgi:hypothetical protein
MQTNACLDNINQVNLQRNYLLEKQWGQGMPKH